MKKKKYDAFAQLAFKHNRECAACNKVKFCSSAHVWSEETRCLNFKQYCPTCWEKMKLKLWLKRLALLLAIALMVAAAVAIMFVISFRLFG